MLTSLLLLAALQTASVAAPKVAADVPKDSFAPLAVYNGLWTVHAAHPWGGGPAGTADLLVSHCTLNLAFFTCEQVVNGKPAELIIYVLGDGAGKYYVQMVLPSGFSTGRSIMSIEGNHWTYLSKTVVGEKTTWYRTDNDFKGPNSIHFTEYESADGTNWAKTDEGDETRSQS